MVIIQYSIVSSDTINALVPALYFKKKNLSTDSQHEISDNSVGINCLSTCKSLLGCIRTITNYWDRSKVYELYK